MSLGEADDDSPIYQPIIEEPTSEEEGEE